MKTNLVKKIVTGLTLSCLLVASGAIVLANNYQEAPNPRNAAMQGKMPKFEDMQQNIDNAINKLVADQTITQEQADKLTGFFKQKSIERKAEMEKMKAMSPEDCRVTMEQRRNNRPDMISELKNAANLSDEQANAVNEAIRPQHGPNHNGPMRKDMPKPEDMEKHMNNNLDKLVTAGTITQQQADQLTDFFKQKHMERQTEMEKMKTMSPDDFRAAMKQKRNNCPDIISELKNAANLSDEQANAVTEAIRPHHAPNHE